MTSRRQFRQVYARGRRFPGSTFAIFALPNQLDHPRIGFTVTRKVGCAVVRNRVKRRLRELFRIHRHGLDVGLDLVVNAYPVMVGKGYREIEHEFARALDRLAARARR